MQLWVWQDWLAQRWWWWWWWWSEQPLRIRSPCSVCGASRVRSLRSHTRQNWSDIWPTSWAWAADWATTASAASGVCTNTNTHHPQTLEHTDANTWQHACFLEDICLTCCFVVIYYVQKKISLKPKNKTNKKKHLVATCYKIKIEYIWDAEQRIAHH